MDFRKPENLVLLPGVNVETKKMDGSVRYYGDWTVTLPATDSTEEVSGIIRVYQSFDFNEDGKFALVQGYGDWGGMNNYFSGSGDDDDDEDEDKQDD
jgi:hypothetical protein